VGARRDDITSQQRAQIAIEVLSPHRPWGDVKRLAEEYKVERKTLYDIATAGKRALEKALAPGPHGPQVREKTILVNRNRLVRSSMVLTEVGVSQRDVVHCVQELLDSQVSDSWVQAELAKAERVAAARNAAWAPTVAETLSGDEIYSNGNPNLLVVGNDSLYIYALTRQPTCDGDTWGSVLLDSPDCAQFASDGGKGLAAGAREAEVGAHQLDWDHLLRPLWGQAARLETQAYAALDKVEQRVKKIDQTHTPKRVAQHWTAWEQLSVQADEEIDRHDKFLGIARQVDGWFALIDIESGHLRDPVVGAESLRDLGNQLKAWSGRIYQKLSDNLIHFAAALFAYHPVLAQALSPLIEQWGEPAICTLSQIWQIEADEKRRPLPLLERHNRQTLWEACLDQAATLLGPEQLWHAWDALCSVLDRSWRGSMLAECVNSLLRPVLDRRKHTDQGCLELFRFLHNVRSFERGKRAGHSPAHLVGLDLPDDPLTLLGLEPKVLI
jgi:hypothetical protein